MREREHGRRSRARVSAEAAERTDTETRMCLSRKREDVDPSLGSYRSPVPPSPGRSLPCARIAEAWNREPAGRPFGRSRRICIHMTSHAPVSNISGATMEIKSRIGRPTAERDAPGGSRPESLYGAGAVSLPAPAMTAFAISALELHPQPPGHLTSGAVRATPQHARRRRRHRTLPFLFNERLCSLLLRILFIDFWNTRDIKFIDRSCSFSN